jgi:hypothetical protein
MFVPCINSIKALLLFHNDAHDHKITGILKQLKNSDGHSDMFRFTLCLAKTTVMILYPRRS